MHPKPHFLPTLLTAAGLTLVAAVPAAAQSPLYQVGDLADPARSAAAVEERNISVRAQRLTASTAEIELELLNGALVIASRDQPAEVRGSNELTWRGLIEGTYRVTLTRNGSLIAGSFDTDIGPHSILPRDRGVHTLALLDQALLGDCGNDGSGPSGEKSERFSSNLMAPAYSAEPARASSPVEVTILGLYTPQARQRFGSDLPGGPPVPASMIRIAIQNAIDQANTAFIDSDSGMRFELVHTAEANHDDSGSASADITWMRASAQVSSLRDEHAADLVGLVVGELQPGLCGRASDVLENPYGDPEIAYQVTRVDCLDSMTYAHEFGHLVGMNHDLVDDPEDAIFPFAFGHFNAAGGFRTIMAISCPGCVGVAHFSNPDVTENGFPTGIAGERDNAQVADMTASVVADYRKVTDGGPALVSTFFQLGTGHTESVTDTENGPSFDFFYDGVSGNWEERPGGPCNQGQDNPTYLKIRYEGPPMASCSYQFSYGSGQVIPCSEPIREFLNSHAEVIIATDVWEIDADPSSPNFCGPVIPITQFLGFNSPEWIRLDLTTDTDGQSVSRQVNFVKVIEDLPF